MQTEGNVISDQDPEVAGHGESFRVHVPESNMNVEYFLKNPIVTTVATA
jgi:hypothetical protein